MLRHLFRSSEAIKLRLRNQHSRFFKTTAPALCTNERFSLSTLPQNRISQLAIKMKVKFVIILLSTLAQPAVLAGPTSARLGRTAQDINAGGDAEKQTNHLRMTKKVHGGESIAIQDDETTRMIHRASRQA
jgi:hypothetical protein